jgi:hypothetical protein
MHNKNCTAILLADLILVIIFVVYSRHYVNGRQTGFVTLCIGTAFYSGLLKERYKGG